MMQVCSTSIVECIQNRQRQFFVGTRPGSTEGIPQEKLGIQIGIDGDTASARVSRYENETHTPPCDTVLRLAIVQFHISLRG